MGEPEGGVIAKPPRYEKREAPLTMHAAPALKRAIQIVARSEDLAASTWLRRLAQSHPAVQAEMQKAPE